MAPMSDAPQDGPRPSRRRRYRGTHPRSFEERYKERDPRRYPEMQQHVRSQGRTPAGSHVPIMVAEVLAALDPRPGDVVADCTLGYGGHAEAMLARVGAAGRLVGFDVDATQLERTGRRLAECGAHISLHRSNFAGIAKALASDGLDGYDVIFADLGVSSMQLDDPARGFSYKHDGPLDMRMDDRLRATAADLVMRLPEEELSAALLELADEPDHARIARAIVQARARRPIERTAQLLEIVQRAQGASPRGRQHGGEEGPHPAARAFQALRILVNDELGSLQHLLRIAPSCLRPGGRIGILAFHSGEDRLVKHAFRDGVASGSYADAAGEPVRPTAQERHDNPRSAAARFRWARRPA